MADWTESKMGMSISPDGEGETGPAVAFDEPTHRSFSGRQTNKAAVSMRTGGTNTPITDNIDAEDMFPELDSITEALAAVVRKVTINGEYGNSTAGDGDWFSVAWAKNEEAIRSQTQTTTNLTGVERESIMDDSYQIYSSPNNPTLQASGFRYDPAWQPVDRQAEYLEWFDEDDAVHFAATDDNAVLHMQWHFYYEIVKRNSVI